MVNDPEEGRLLSLARRPEQIACLHFSATPKASQVLLGDINEKAAGHVWKDIEKYKDWYTNEDVDLDERGRWMAHVTFKHQQKHKSAWNVGDGPAPDHEKEKTFEDIGEKALDTISMIGSMRHVPPSSR